MEGLLSRGPIPFSLSSLKFICAQLLKIMQQKFHSAGVKKSMPKYIKEFKYIKKQYTFFFSFFFYLIKFF